MLYQQNFNSRYSHIIFALEAYNITNNNETFLSVNQLIRISIQHIYMKKNDTEYLVQPTVLLSVVLLPLFIPIMDDH